MWFARVMRRPHPATCYVGTRWLKVWNGFPEDGVVLTRADLELVFIDLRALVGGTDRLAPNRAYAVVLLCDQSSNRTDRWRTVMTKPRAVQWLEDQTGQSIDVTPDPVGVQERHLWSG